MTRIAKLVADNIDNWTSAIQRKSGAGRGGGKRISLYGIERLRALILDMAVRGKLVPQDAGNEPASELLKAIKAERTKLIKAKAISKGKSFPTVSAEPPFAIPANWIWTQVSEIGHDWGQTEPTANFTYIDVGSIDQSLGIVQSPKVVSASEAPSRARKVVRKGTVIYSTVRPYLLNIAIVDQKFDPEPIASTAFAIIHPYTGIEASFIYRYLRSRTFVSYVESCQTGIAYPAINDRQFFAAWCPLPPFAEQRRIVAKVDELMALCDALERESAGAMAAHQALVDVLLATLVDSADAADLARQWARLESHYDTLFTTDASIDALKQTILDLAIRGKLVEQDAADEPASELIIKIKKAQTSGHYKSRAILKSGEESEFNQIPSGWKRTQIGEIFSIKTGFAFKSATYAKEGTLVFRVTNFGRDGAFDLSDSVYFPTAEIDSKLSGFLLDEDDVIMVMVGGTIGKTTMVDNSILPALLNQNMWRIRSYGKLMDCRFEYLLVKNLNAKIEGLTQSTHGHFAMGDFAKRSVSLPPLAEQRRIVAKVAALMALCDALKARLADAAQTQRHLADAITQRAAA